MNAVTRAPRTAWGIAVIGVVVAVGSLALEPFVISGAPDQWSDGIVSVRYVFIAALTLLVGARVVSHMPRLRYGWLLLATGFTAALSAALSLAAAVPGPWVIQWGRQWVWFLSYALFTLTALLFPDGLPPSARWRLPLRVLYVGLGVGLIGLAVWSSGDEEPVGSGDVWGIAALCGLVALFISAVLGPVAIAVRARRAAPALKTPLRWGAISAVLVLLGMVLEVLPAFGFPRVGWTAVTAALVFPAATALMIARYGLYDIDRIVHRSMLYGALVLAAGGVYAVALPTTGWLINTMWKPDGPDPLAQSEVAAQAAAIVAAAAAVLAVLLLRSWLYEFLERRLYGYAARPYELLSSLASGVGTALTPGEMLGAVVDGVADGLRVPYAAVFLAPRESPEQAVGDRRPWPVTSLDLVHRGDTIGQLVVQQRAPDEPWTRRERKLLAALAAQVAAPAAAVRLIRDLQQARERLVTAREEEKRRLRKDLHDGVGPVLSGVRMQLRALAGTSAAEPGLSGIEEDLALASDELRRAIDGLRPPGLDRGLVPALRGVVERHVQAGDAEIALDIPETLDLPAAVEVALYRILDEALTNCVRHAAASSVQVAVQRRTDAVELTVTDDGRGFAGPRDDGVGTESMRQRCEEIGGRFTIAAAAPTGTVVAATLPLS